MSVNQTNNTSKTTNKYDPDLIALITLIVDHIRRKNYSTSELYYLEKHLDQDTEITLKLLRIEGLISRLSQEIIAEKMRLSEFASQLDKLKGNIDHLARLLE